MVSRVAMEVTEERWKIETKELKRRRYCSVNYHQQFFHWPEHLGKISSYWEWHLQRATEGRPFYSASWQESVKSQLQTHEWLHSLQCPPLLYQLEVLHLCQFGTFVVLASLPQIWQELLLEVRPGNGLDLFEDPPQLVDERTRLVLPLGTTVIQPRHFYDDDLPVCIHAVGQEVRLSTWKL